MGADDRHRGDGRGGVFEENGSLVRGHAVFSMERNWHERSNLAPKWISPAESLGETRTDRNVCLTVSSFGGGSARETRLASAYCDGRRQAWRCLRLGHAAFPRRAFACRDGGLR